MTKMALETKMPLETNFCFGSLPEPKKLRPSPRSFVCAILRPRRSPRDGKKSEPTPPASPDAEERPVRPTPRRFHPTRRPSRRHTPFAFHTWLQNCPGYVDKRIHRLVLLGEALWFAIW